MDFIIWFDFLKYFSSSPPLFFFFPFPWVFYGCKNSTCGLNCSGLLQRAVEPLMEPAGLKNYPNICFSTLSKPLHQEKKKKKRVCATFWPQNNNIKNAPLENPGWSWGWGCSRDSLELLDGDRDMGKVWDLGMGLIWTGISTDELWGHSQPSPFHDPKENPIQNPRFLSFLSLLKSKPSELLRRCNF